MSFQHSPEDHIDRKVLLAVAEAIRSLETVTGTIVKYEIGCSDAHDLHYVMRRLWAILETNDYNIDIDTNRLRRTTP